MPTNRVDRLWYSHIVEQYAIVEMNAQAFIYQIASLVAQRLKHLPAMRETWV